VPLTEHGLHDASTDSEQIERWFGAPANSNIAIAIPENIVVLDVDPRNGGDVTLKEWCDMYGAGWLEGVPYADTGRGDGGRHYWFRYNGERLRKDLSGIDFQRLGKYVVAPPSTTSQEYKWGIALPQDLGQLPELPGWLLLMARPEERPEATPRASMMMSASGDDPLDAAAHRMTTWDGLLGRHGWKCVAGQQIEGSKWRHPQSDNQFSATIRHDCLFVYSPNTPFPVTESGDPRGVTLFSALETLDYNGDRKACLRALRDAGYLEDRPRPVGDIRDLLPSADVRRGAGASTAPTRHEGPPAAVLGTGESGASLPAAQFPQFEPLPARLELSTLEDREMRRSRWLWDGRLPMGGLTLLAGREGEGKSTLAIRLMAETTRGTLEGEFYGEPKDVIIIATEDSYEYTIIPRLVAAGADMHRVHTITMLDDTESLQLPVHLPDLETACEDYDVALIVMDPLLSRLSGNLDSHKDADVRRALEPLGKFADKMRASILGLIHLNKSGSTDPLTAVMASKAFTAFARAVLFAMVDPEDENRRLLGLVKSNLGPTNLPTLTYTFATEVVGYDEGDIVATRIEWGEPSETSIRSALEIPPENRSTVENASTWLRDYLISEGGSAPARSVQSAGQKVDDEFKSHTLRRALKRIGGEIRGVGFPATSVWYLEASRPGFQR
jgi:archaellum biogenesis ATPase FlaH